MKCPNCGAVFDDTCRFCGACGTPLTPEKKGRHRVPILIMVGLTILGMCVFFATSRSAAEPAPTEPTDDSICFSAENGNLRFDSSAYSGSGQLTVPETVNGNTVEWIDDRCFAGCEVLTQVHLPNTVRHIGTAAFADCSALRGMDLPQGLITVGREAFSGCASLEAVHIPRSVNFIGMDAFAGCGRLSYIFYDGTWQKWNQICNQDLGPGVLICCTDGNYPQSE